MGECLRAYAETNPCPKCGFMMMKDEYDGRCGSNRIHRLCLRCSYKWDEWPLDYDRDAELLSMHEFNMRFDRMTGCYDEAFDQDIRKRLRGDC